MAEAHRGCGRVRRRGCGVNAGEDEPPYLRRDPRDREIAARRRRIRELERQLAEARTAAANEERKAESASRVSSAKGGDDEGFNQWGIPNQRRNRRAGLKPDRSYQTLGMKIDLPEVKGISHPDEFIDWLYRDVVEENVAPVYDSYEDYNDVEQYTSESDVLRMRCDVVEEDVAPVYDDYEDSDEVLEDHLTEGEEITYADSGESLVVRSGIAEATILATDETAGYVAVQGQPEDLSTVDFPTCESIRMSQQVDKTGERTVAVVNFSARCNVPGLVSSLMKCGKMKGIMVEDPFEVFEESPQVRRVPSLVRVERMFEQIQSKQCLSEDVQRDFAQEIYIWRKVRHKNVVQFVGARTKPPCLCITAKCMSDGSLYDFLHHCPSVSLPLCTDSRAPLPQKTPLTFCPYNGTSCCNSGDDKQLKNQYDAMNISDSGCASLVKSILCAKCDQFSADLFSTSSAPRELPILCNSTTSANSTQSGQARNNFCSEVWTTCQNVSIVNSPFAASLKGKAPTPVKSNSTKLTDLWQSEDDFCNAFGGASSDGSVCFAGEPVALNTTEPLSPAGGLCLEKIGNGSYLDMAAHPDGSNRTFFSSQEGKIWLATIPEVDSGNVLELDETNPFLDVTDEVHFDTQFGMMGIAFHPKFSQNGHFFASFNCDKQSWAGCAGRCSCNSDVDCDPSTLPSDSGSRPCQYQSVIAEFTVNGTANQPSEAKSASPKEVRRIFTMGLPFTAHHGGQILFGPTDGYLYFMMGDGGGSGDPYNFSQNKKSLLGKIMRLDVDSTPSAEEIDKLALWGNYTIPKDNPYIEDKELQPEIWALGMRNPWRCSFDSARPSYFMCADVGQDRYEEVDIITKGGNYGWRVYEGPRLFTPPKSPSENISINPIFPVMGYNHSDVNKDEGSASITGGYFYRSTTDPCMSGRYLYADLYAGAMWAGTESPENSGTFNTTEIPFSCAGNSPINCASVPGSTVPALGYIFSYGQDNNKDVYLLASSGVYRIVRPSRCKYTCAKENATDIATPPPGTSPPSAAVAFTGPYKNLVLLLLSFLLMVLS